MRRLLLSHIMGGTACAAVLQAHRVVRDENGRFLSVEGVSDPG
jgi:hypothetical protein